MVCPQKRERGQSKRATWGSGISGVSCVSDKRLLTQPMSCCPLNLPKLPFAKRNVRCCVARTAPSRGSRRDKDSPHGTCRSQQRGPHPAHHEAREEAFRHIPYAAHQQERTSCTARQPRGSKRSHEVPSLGYISRLHQRAGALMDIV